MDGSISIGWAWGIGLISFAFGIAGGVFLAVLLSGSRHRAEELEHQLTDQQRQFDDYRSQVSQHFRQTSELVQKMTDSYRSVYEHLASGSQTLCQEPVPTPQLDIPKQPVLDGKKQTAASDAVDQGAFSDAETDPFADPETDTLLGDAPNVPSLETEQPLNSRTPSA